jgi:hypothetical protein
MNEHPMVGNVLSGSSILSECVTDASYVIVVSQKAATLIDSSQQAAAKPIAPTSTTQTINVDPEVIWQQIHSRIRPHV